MMQQTTNRRQFIQLLLLSTLAASLAACEEETAVNTTNSEKIILIGAGMAGLAAAQKLQQAGHQTIILEARDRLGGRIFTDRSLAGIPLDMGASWIHGIRGNPITALAKEFKVATQKSDYDNRAIYDWHGRQLNKREVAKLDQFGETLYELIEKARSQMATDTSLQTALDTIFAAEGWSQEEIYQANYIVNGLAELEYADNGRNLSLFEWDQDESFPGPDHHFPDGYDQIVQGLAAGLDIRLQHVVTAVNYSDEGVIVESNQGQFTSQRVIITLPLGVLQKGNVRFTPALPSGKQNAIQSLQMGVLHKTYLLFPKLFWEEDRDLISHIAEQKGQWTEFLNLHMTTGKPVLMGFNSGWYGRELEQLPEAEVVERMMSVLRKLYGSSIPAPEAWLISRWHIDPFAFGTYSHIPPCVTGKAHDELAKAVDGRLFFAGEATNRTYSATVHGAFLSGQRAAQEVINSLKT